MPLIHFLLVFDHKRGELVHQEEFSDAATAAEAYSDLERRHRDDEGLEIVLVSADSIETIQQTHGNYFNGASAAPDASPYLTGV